MNTTQTNKVKRDTKNAHTHTQQTIFVECVVKEKKFSQAIILYFVVTVAVVAFISRVALCNVESGLVFVHFYVG